MDPRVYRMRDLGGRDVMIMCEFQFAEEVGFGVHSSWKR